MNYKISVGVQLSDKRTSAYLPFLVYFLMYFSNDTYMFGSNRSELMQAIPRYLLLIFCVVEFFLIVPKFSRVWKVFVPSIAMASGIIISSLIINNDSFSRVVIKLICLFAALFFVCRFKFNIFAESYNKAIYLICVPAIIFELLLYVFPSLFYLLPQIINTAGHHYSTFIFAGVNTNNAGSLFIRSSGIFWEPGAFQVFINLAIFFELFALEKVNRKRLTIYYLALLFTFSTTGYIACFWLLLGYILFDRNNISKRNKIISIIVVSVLLVLFIVFPDTPLGNIVFGKLSDLSTGTTMVRFAGIVVNLIILKDNILFGIGMDKMPDVFLATSLIPSVRNFLGGFTHQNTNTLLYQYSAFGLFYGTLFTVGWFHFGKNISSSFWLRIWIFSFLFILFISENFMVSIWPFVLVFYGYLSCDKKNYLEGLS